MVLAPDVVAADGTLPATQAVFLGQEEEPQRAGLAADGVPEAVLHRARTTDLEAAVAGHAHVEAGGAHVVEEAHRSTHPSSQNSASGGVGSSSLRSAGNGSVRVSLRVRSLTRGDALPPDCGTESE